jgi:hypothetical protein
VDAAYVKATEGTSYQNPDAPGQVKALRGAGIHVGLYHFLTPSDGASAQAQFFLGFAQALGGSDLPLAIDSETAAPGGWPQLAQDMVAFAMQIEAEPSVVRCPLAMFYCNLSFAASLPGFPWGRLVWLADPNPGAPHRPCLVLQGAPRPEGGFSSIDPDTFLGTEAQWQAFISSGEAPVGPPNPVPSPPAAQEFDMATLPNITVGVVAPPNIVKSVQALLHDKFNQTALGVNGNYGAETIAALKAVQTFFSMPVTGEVDAAMWEVLLEA